MLMKYCVQCVLPNTKPDLQFNDLGICTACVSYSNRNLINWDERKKDFELLVSKHISKNKWDCIIPVSGGKDSTAQVLKVLELGLTPLCVNSSTCSLSEIGRKNIENLKNLGVDLIEFSPNPKVRKQLNRIGLEVVGDISWAEHVGIFTIPVRAAVYFDVPLIIWGENSQNEYGGPSEAQNSAVLDRRWLEEFGGLLGLRVSDLRDNYGISQKDLFLYTYPDVDEILRVGVTGVFLGHFFPWDGLKNFELARINGFTPFDSLIEGSMVNYENIDNFQHGIHDYFKFLKFGFGRTTDLASIYIRRGRITREQALQIVKDRDGKYPWSYLGKPLDIILNQIDMTISEFNVICDRFTNKNLFIKNQHNQLVRDATNSLIKIKYDN